MSAVFADIPLCQSTPEIREWVRKNIPADEARPFQWPSASPNIFHGLTYFPHTEANLHRRLNVLRWPNGASRWATYDFLATDNQLAELRNAVYGGDGDPKGSDPAKLILHGGGDTVTVEEMWLLPPRPLSCTPSWLTTVNRLWWCTLVDQRYWWNQKHCGDLSEFSTWDELLNHLRDQVGLTTTLEHNAWDCPAVAAHWLAPHVDLLAAHSLPLGMMIDAVAWNVGRRVAVDLTKTDPSYPAVIHVREASWHKGRSAGNLTQTGWYRLAGGDFAFDDRDLSAMIPSKVRVTFADGTDARDYSEVNTAGPEVTGYETENGTGTTVFHDRLDVADADSGARFKLTTEVAQAYLDFAAWASFDIAYVGHVNWLPEALSDAVEWHELHDEGECLVPDPADGKVRQRRELQDMVRTHVMRGPFNLLADDLWHGNGGAGSGSGTTAPGEFSGTCPDGTRFTIAIHGHEVTVTMPEA